NQLPADGGTLRNALEGILQHIRFTTMTAEEFVEGPAGDAVLTAEEQVRVLKWFAAAVPQSIFPSTPRYSPGNYVCERLTPRNFTWLWQAIWSAAHAIDFSVSRAVSVTGLGAYGFYNDGARVSGGLQLNDSIVAKLSLGSVVLAEKKLTVSVDSSNIISINFDKPIKIKAEKRYTASAVVTGPSPYYGYNGASSKTVATKRGDVVFNFMQSAVSSNTTVAQGMIPQIHFRI
ncbi:BTB/POZ domain-containing protein 6, partial [Aphelenchoides avenae]